MDTGGKIYDFDSKTGTPRHSLRNLQLFLILTLSFGYVIR